MPSANTLITASSYNTIRTTISNILGIGGGATLATSSKGYGQNLVSESVPANQLVSQFDWDLLRYDIVNARVHQTGSGSLTDINVNDLISSSTATTYETLSNTSASDAERFKVASGQHITTSSVTTNSREYSADTSPQTWLGEINAIFRVTFPSAAAARYFFNSGGEIRVISNRSNPTNRSADTAQSTSWTTLLSAAATQAFGGIYSAVSTSTETRAAQNGFNFYNLTTGWTEFYRRTNSSPYQLNTYRLEARCNVASNVGGTATYVEIRVRFVDDYTDPPSGTGALGFPREVGPEDLVDGIFSITVSEKKAFSTSMNPIITTTTATSNNLAPTTITVPTADVLYAKPGMLVFDGGSLVGSGRRIVSSTTAGSNTIFTLSSSTASVVPAGTIVTIQNKFEITSPSYSFVSAISGS